jgi:hypothetical protein
MDISPTGLTSYWTRGSYYFADPHGLWRLIDSVISKSCIIIVVEIIQIINNYIQSINIYKKNLVFLCDALKIMHV